uniref:Major facilitator superfamily (MFS) profile domain-containing protein n=1 Tax=Plectus sambesii TaxID=2011161 RepID=A0A914UMN1_9BILA
MTKPLFFSVLAVTLGSSFQFGYNIGCVNAPGQLITDWFRGSHQRMFNSTMTKDQADFTWSVAVAIFSIGGMFGGLLSGYVADRFGRKGGMLLNNVFALIAAALMGLAKSVDVYLLIIIGRLIIGFNC